MDRRRHGGGGQGPEGPPSPLEQGIDKAILGDPEPLYALLARTSGLPGVRPNANMVKQFARALSVRGHRADDLAQRMAFLDPDVARGGSDREFLPMCGVAVVAQRAIDDPKVRGESLAVLHDVADDLRFRVRDAVAEALGRIGEHMGDALVVYLRAWMDGYFQGAAVLRALAHAPWLAVVRDVGGVVELLEVAFALARDAERAAARFPGRKALVEVLGTTPGALATRLGVPVFDMLERWSVVKDPVLRDVVARNLEGTRIAGRYASEVLRVRNALLRTAPARRDPNTDVGPTRGRGRKRRR